MAPYCLRMDTNANATRNARLGNGSAVHMTDDRGILCNRWGTVNGTWKPAKPTDDAATCQRCARIAREATR